MAAGKQTKTLVACKCLGLDPLSVAIIDWSRYVLKGCFEGDMLEWTARYNVRSVE